MQNSPAQTKAKTVAAANPYVQAKKEEVKNPYATKAANANPYANANANAKPASSNPYAKPASSATSKANPYAKVASSTSSTAKKPSAQKTVKSSTVDGNEKVSECKLRASVARELRSAGFGGLPRHKSK